jgi:GT2 family glycosyltransferase
MSSPLVSIVITTFNRAHLLRPTLESFVKQDFKDYEVIVIDDGTDEATPLLCAEPWPLSLKYYRMNRDRTLGYNNPARPNNVGVRMAKGDIIILQNAEVRHGAGEVILRLSEQCGTMNAVFAQVEVLNEYGIGKSFYCHRTFTPRPFFFCGALRREWFEKLRGFDEDYQYYGYDDVDFADRLAKCGVEFHYTTIEVQHQWHPTSYDHTDKNNAIPALTYARKSREMAEGKIGIERNLGREWGAL